MFSRLVPRLATRALIPSTVIARPMLVTPMLMRQYSVKSKDEISQKLIEVVKNFVKGESSQNITADSKFHKDLGLDSLDTVELIVSIEEEFDTEIPDDVADRLTSIRETIDYLASKNN